MQTRQKSRKTTKAITTSTGVVVETAYCRMCRETKNASDYYVATDVSLDTNGLMSICKICCQKLYENNLKIENSIERALYKTCRTLNIRYDPDAIEVAKQQIKNMNDRGTNATNFFGIYKSKLLAVSSAEIGKRGDIDLTFQEETVLPPPSDPLLDHEKNAEELKQFWGDSMNRDDYIWLEKEYAKWEHDYDIRNSSEVNLLKLIILKLFDIKNARATGSTAKLEKEFQDLLKTSALSPAQSSAASKSGFADTYGMLIKRIEEETPAEYYKDYKLFDDFFDLKKYIKNYITRPISNFFSGQKNYNISGDPEFSFDASAFGSESSTNNSVFEAMQQEENSNGDES